MSQGSLHSWRFFRSGGFDQVELSSGADIAHLAELDQKLWVALACPTTGLTFDATTLELIDTDHDGRICVGEILAACQWICDRLKNHDDLLKGSDQLQLASLSENHPQGLALLGIIKDILSHLGKADVSEISLADVQEFSATLAKTSFNGDGIITSSATEDDVSRTVIADIVATLGGEADRSGEVGVNQALCDQFFAEAHAHAQWWEQGDSVRLQPLEVATQEAFDVLMSVKTKIDDYFSRCRCVAFDERALTALNHQESEYREFATKELAIEVPEMSHFPLARIAPQQPLPLDVGLNPAWSKAIARFKSITVFPLLGEKTSLTESEWSNLCARFSAFATWRAARPNSKVEVLGLERIQSILASPAQETISHLIAQDKTL